MFLAVTPRRTSVPARCSVRSCPLLCAFPPVALCVLARFSVCSCLLPRKEPLLLPIATQRISIHDLDCLLPPISLSAPARCTACSRPLHCLLPLVALPALARCTVCSRPLLCLLPPVALSAPARCTVCSYHLLCKFLLLTPCRDVLGLLGSEV
jgi:hypothetical protein